MDKWREETLQLLKTAQTTAEKQKYKQWLDKYDTSNEIRNYLDLIIETANNLKKKLVKVNGIKSQGFETDLGVIGRYSNAIIATIKKSKV